jgi:hypothetical protein
LAALRPASCSSLFQRLIIDCDDFKSILRAIVCTTIEDFDSNLSCR